MLGNYAEAAQGMRHPEQGVLEPMISGWDWSSCKSAVSEPDHR